MTRFAGVCLLSLCAALSGCVATSYPPPDRRVTIAENLGRDVMVTDVRCTKVAGGLHSFQANVVNVTSREQWVDWKVVWLDAQGMEIDSLVSTWSGVALYPGDVKGLKCVASRPEAVDMRFYLRRAVR